MDAANFVYQYGHNLYINLTNKCSNACSFCIRNTGEGLGTARSLWLKEEPTASEVLGQYKKMVKQGTAFQEVVFCGYGEPTQRLQVLLNVAKELKKTGKTIRLNTNGQGNLINKKNIVPQLAKVIDSVNVSLNASTKEAYQKLCNSKFGEKAFEAMLDFAKECKAAKIKATLSVVGIIEDSEALRCKEIAKSVGADFRIRNFGE